MNVLNKFFDKIYCINVDSRTDRWEECQQMFSKYNLDVERFSAFEPDIEPICCIRKTELSLIRTHREIIKKAKEHNYTNVLIFEDDVEFCDYVIGYNGLSLEERFSKSIDFLPKSWDVFYLGCGNYTDNKIHIEGEIYRMFYAMTTHAISINGKYFDFMIDKLESPTQVLDHIYFGLIHQNETYGFSPNLISQRGSYSSIEEKYVDYNSLRNYL